MSNRQPLHKTDLLERAIYSEICRHNGIKARDIGKGLTADRRLINQYLYNAPFMRELCYQDDEYRWHSMIRQARPHTGLGDFCAYYSTVADFLASSDEAWFDDMVRGCRYIGRSLNDTRGLFHSFRDCRETLIALFQRLNGRSCGDWELAFELRMNRARYIRIYADVLVITENRVFSLEFKMKDVIDPEEVTQAAKYTEYLEVLFGAAYDVVPSLVLTRARDLYDYALLPGTDAAIPVCSGDRLYCLFEEYE